MQKLLDPLLDENTDRAKPCDEDESAPGENTPDASTQTVRRRVHRWTRTHSHYAVMGGYTLDMKKMNLDFRQPQEVKRLTLSPEGLLHLAETEEHLLPDISAEHIKDKSKADGFAKTIVCIQALWFLTQVIGRLAMGCPISLLEMNTMLHALCCLIIYAAWWQKPLEVEETSLIDPSAGLATCREMVWKSNIWYGREFILKGPGCASKPLRVTLKSVKDKDRRRSRYRPTSQPSDLKLDSKDPGYRRLYVSETFQDFRIRVRWSGDDGEFWASRILRPKVADTCYICLSDGDLSTLAHAPHDKSSYDFVRQEAPLFFWNKTSLEEWPESLKRRFKSSDNLEIALLYLLGLLASGSVYAGIHLIAWHNHFPSPAEKYIWRASCFIIASALMIALALFVVVKITEWYSRHPFAMEWEKFNDAVETGIGIFSLCVLPLYGLFYVAARAYLVAESFRGLGYLPVEVYKEPEWSKYFPHFGAG